MFLQLCPPAEAPEKRAADLDMLQLLQRLLPMALSQHLEQPASNVELREEAFVPANLEGLKIQKSFAFLLSSANQETISIAIEHDRSMC